MKSHKNGKEPPQKAYKKYNFIISGTQQAQKVAHIVKNNLRYDRSKWATPGRNAFGRKGLIIVPFCISTHRPN